MKKEVEMEKAYKTEGFSLTQKDLKIIAIAAMLIDHIAWMFVPTSSQAGQIMHFIGRLTMPIMCYFIAEGYEKTRNAGKYLLRLFIFAAISHFPFQYFLWGKIPLFSPGPKYYPAAYYTTGVIYTLALGLLALMAVKSKKVPLILKPFILCAILFAAQIGDYRYFGVLWVLFFGLFHHDRFLMTVSFLAVTLGIVLPAFTNPQSYFMFGTFLPIIPILLYNGRKGEGRSWKLFFYIFYPVHLVILGFLRNLYK